MNDFFELEVKWQTGMARCKCCGYEWVAVSEVETEWLECPECKKMCGDYKKDQGYCND